MNLENVQNTMSRIYTKASKIMVKKNKDYASTNDVYQNFTNLAILCSLFKVDVTSTEGVIEFFKLHKLCRWFKLHHSKGVPVNESLEDTVIDEFVYTILREVRGK